MNLFYILNFLYVPTKRERERERLFLVYGSAIIID